MSRNKTRNAGIITCILFVFSASFVHAAPACPALDTPLAYGSSSNSVRTLQQFFAERYTLPAQTITGTFGPATRRTIIRFQKEVGLPQTGTLGPATRAAIRTCGIITKKDTTQSTLTTTTNPLDGYVLVEKKTVTGGQNTAINITTIDVPIISIAQFKNGTFVKWLVHDLSGTKSALGSAFKDPTLDKTYIFTWFLKDIEPTQSMLQPETDIRIFKKR